MRNLRRNALPSWPDRAAAWRESSTTDDRAQNNATICSKSFRARSVSSKLDGFKPSSFGGSAEFQMSACCSSQGEVADRSPDPFNFLPMEDLAESSVFSGRNRVRELAETHSETSNPNVHVQR
jgi:hypothetical protein